jgi:hypothetical protein
LTEDQKKLIQKFIKLKGKSYLDKKIALRMFFMGKWL